MELLKVIINKCIITFALKFSLLAVNYIMVIK